jgi:hypothetical protein
VTRRERLGRLAEGPPAESYPGFADDLRTCCARVVSAAGHLAGPAAGEPDLLFVGRSPESLFDYLRGVCRRTGWFDRQRMLHFSMRGDVAERHLRRDYPTGLAALRVYFATLGLDPVSLLTRSQPAVLVDLVCNGETFFNLVRLLRRGCFERGVPWHAARRSVRLVGLTRREPKLPATYRWHLHGPAIDCLERGAARSVPLPERLWDYLGNRQPKVAESYPPARWGREDAGHAFRSADHAPALRLALSLYEAAQEREERLSFIRELVSAGGLRLASLRTLASQLRGS